MTDFEKWFKKYFGTKPKEDADIFNYNNMKDAWEAAKKLYQNNFLPKIKITEEEREIIKNLKKIL